MNTTTRLITVDNKKLWVEEEGSGEPLVLLPGGPAASHRIFRPYFSSLASRYRTNVSHLVLANTLHSPEMWQKNHENINREISNQYPEVWDNILELRKQGVRSSDPALRQQFASVPANNLLRFYNPGLAAELLDGKWAPNLDLYFEFVGHDIDFFIGGQLGLIPDFRPLLKELEMPVLIMAGRHDRALYPRYQIEFKQYCPQAVFLMFEESGSFIHIEERAKLREILEGFLG